jgi:hypothetical protein
MPGLLMFWSIAYGNLVNDEVAVFLHWHALALDLYKDLIASNMLRPEFSHAQLAQPGHFVFFFLSKYVCSLS